MSKKLIQKRKPGNQPLSKYEQEALVYALQPYLQSGLSIRKACLASGVSRATLYKVLDERPELKDQIVRFQNYLSILTAGTITRQLVLIHQKQVEGHNLDWNDLRFLMWFATNSRHCRDEFGNTARREPSIDPQAEIRKIVTLIDTACNSLQAN